MLDDRNGCTKCRALWRVCLSVNETLFAGDVSWTAELAFSCWAYKAVMAFVGFAFSWCFGAEALPERGGRVRDIRAIRVGWARNFG